MPTFMGSCGPGRRRTFDPRSGSSRLAADFQGKSIPNRSTSGLFKADDNPTINLSRVRFAHPYRGVNILQDMETSTLFLDDLKSGARRGRYPRGRVIADGTIAPRRAGCRRDRERGGTTNLYRFTREGAEILSTRHPTPTDHVRSGYFSRRTVARVPSDCSGHAADLCVPMAGGAERRINQGRLQPPRRYFRQGRTSLRTSEARIRALRLSGRLRSQAGETVQITDRGNEFKRRVSSCLLTRRYTHSAPRAIGARGYI